MTDDRKHYQYSTLDAVIYLMVLCSASDGVISQNELRTIGRIVRSYPFFGEVDEENLVKTAKAGGALMASGDGLHKVLRTAQAVLLPHLTETAYAAAVDVVTADERLAPHEIRVLDLICSTLGVSDKGAQAVDHAARARHMTLTPV